MVLYTLVSDLSYLVKSKFKYFIIYIISLLIYLLFQEKIGIKGDTALINIIGISFQDDILSKLIFILNQVFLIFITYTIFMKDFRISVDNIFLRTTIKKWLIVKFFSMFMITFFFKTFMFLLMYIILVLIKCGNLQFYSLLKTFLNYSLYLLFLQSLSILFISLIYVNKSFIIPIFALILIFLKKIFIPLEFNNIGIYLIFIILTIFILEKIYIRKFVFFFERSNI